MAPRNLALVRAEDAERLRAFAPRQVGEYRSPIDPGSAQGTEFLELGTTGLKRSSGFVYEEFLVNLRGVNAIKLYREMLDNVSILGAVGYVIDALIRKVKWRVEASKHDTSGRWKEFLEQVIGDMSHTYEDWISEILSMLGYGWSWFETVYKIRRGEGSDPTTNSQYADGLVGWRKHEIRAQETLWQWDYDVDNSLRGMIQLDPWVGRRPVFVPVEKSLLFRTAMSKGNPEGRSLLRPSVVDYWYLKRIREVEAIGIERDLTGLLHQQVPRELLLTRPAPEDAALRIALETMLSQVKLDQRSFLLTPPEMDREGKPTGFKTGLLTTGGRKQVDADPVIRRYEQRIAMTFLAQFVMIGMEKVGTESLFKGVSNLFGVASGSQLDRVGSVINKYGVGRLMTLNGVPRDQWPTLEHGDVVGPDVDLIGGYVQKLSAAGLLSPNRKLEGRLLDMASLPVPDDEELEVFDDETVPTPAEPEDHASGVLSQRQIDSILKINENLAARKLSRKAAAQLAAATLGMSPEAAMRYLNDEDLEPLLTPELGAGEPQAPGAPKPKIPENPSAKKPPPK